MPHDNSSDSVPLDVDDEARMDSAMADPQVRLMVDCFVRCEPGVRLALVTVARELAGAPL